MGYILTYGSVSIAKFPIPDYYVSSYIGGIKVDQLSHARGVVGRHGEVGLGKSVYRYLFDGGVGANY